MVVAPRWSEVAVRPAVKAPHACVRSEGGGGPLRPSPPPATTATAAAATAVTVTAATAMA